MKVWVELAGENPPLAVAELNAVLELFGAVGEEEPALAELPRWRAFELPAADRLAELAQRLALAHRLVLPTESVGLAEVSRDLTRRALSAPGPARFDVLSGERSLRSHRLHELAVAFQSAGGRLDLDAPEIRFTIWGTDPSSLRLALDGPPVGRATLEQRRMPSLPFQRPVSLHPRLARAAANLARVRSGSRVADPFVGTGALLLEAGLLGGRLFGADLDPEMVRGTTRNLEAFGLHAEALSVHDAAAAIDELPWPELDAILTDPPYGRASSTGGEPPVELLARVLPIWAERVVPEGRVVVIGPAGPDPLPPPWECVVSVADRVHRSLTREFRVYRRPPVDRQ